MIVLLVLLHILVCLILILFVLLQSGKAADLAGAFGGGGSQTAFGARGAQTFLSKMTSAAAITFMCTSLALGIVSTRRSRSVIEDLPAEPAAAETGSPAPAEGPPLEEPAPPPVGGNDDGSATGDPAGPGELAPDTPVNPDPGGSSSD